MLVKDVMSTEVEAITPTTTVRECAHKMDQLGWACFRSGRMERWLA
jgi:hypothetical protein